MKRDLALWAGLLTAPIVWFASLLAKFALAGWICSFHWKPAVYLVSALALALTGGAGLLAWTQWRQLAHDGVNGGTIARPQAMALGGVLLSASFLVVLLAQSLPELMMAGCE